MNYINRLMKKLQSIIKITVISFVISVAAAAGQSAATEVSRGFALLQSENFTAAAQTFAAVLQTDPHHYEARVGLAIALIGVERFADASREIAKLLSRRPKDPKLLEMAAQTFWRQNRFVETETVLRRLIDLGGAGAEIWALYGDALDAQKKTPEAVLAYREAVRLRPDSIDYRYALGSLYWKSIDYAAAEAEFLEILRRAPKEPRASFNLGDIYLSKGQAAKALPFLETAAAAFAGEFDTRLAYGRALAAVNQFEKAATELEAAVKLKPEIPEGHFQLGLALQRTGRRAEAAAAFKEAKRLQDAKREAEKVQPQPK